MAGKRTIVAAETGTRMMMMIEERMVTNALVTRIW